MHLIVRGSLLIATLSLAIGLQADDSRIRQKPASKKSARQKTDQAQTVEPNDRITTACRACIDRDWSTVGMVRCAQVELLQREHELEEVEGEFLHMLDERFGEKAAKDFLKSRHRWEKYRDAEFKLIDEMFRKLDGSMYRPIQVSEKSDIVHQRSKQLRGMRALLKDASQWRDASE